MLASLSQGLVFSMVQLFFQLHEWASFIHQSHANIHRSVWASFIHQSHANIHRSVWASFIHQSHANIHRSVVCRLFPI